VSHGRSGWGKKGAFEIADVVAIMDSRQESNAILVPEERVLQSLKRGPGESGKSVEGTEKFSAKLVDEGW
jgi:hypothetical protein